MQVPTLNMYACSLYLRTCVELRFLSNWSGGDSTLFSFIINGFCRHCSRTLLWRPVHISLSFSRWTILKGNHHYFKLCYYV